MVVDRSGTRVESELAELPALLQDASPSIISSARIFLHFPNLPISSNLNGTSSTVHRHSEKSKRWFLLVLVWEGPFNSLFRQPILQSQLSNNLRKCCQAITSYSVFADVGSCIYGLTRSITFIRSQAQGEWRFIQVDDLNEPWTIR